MIKVYKSLVEENELAAEAYYTNGKSRRGETITSEDIDEVKFKEVLLKSGYSEKKADKEIEKLIEKKEKDKKEKVK